MFNSVVDKVICEECDKGVIFTVETNSEARHVRKEGNIGKQVILLH